MEGGMGGGLPCPFSKIGKKCLNFGKNALIKVICWLFFSFKMQFLRVSRRKNRIFFPAGPFFLVLCMIFYESALIPRKLPCPEKFPVTRLNSRDYMYSRKNFIKVSFLWNLWNFSEQLLSITTFGDVSVSGVSPAQPYHSKKYLIWLTKQINTLPSNQGCSVK